MEWIKNQFKDADNTGMFNQPFSKEKVKNAHHFHQSMPQYEKTPVHELTGRSTALGFGTLFVKDESARFGLNAFKGLGVSYNSPSHMTHRVLYSSKMNEQDSV